MVALNNRNSINYENEEYTILFRVGGAGKVFRLTEKMWGITKRSGKAAEPAVMLHGRGLCGSQGVQAFTPALLLTRAWMGSSYISHSQMHVHLTELEAEICHRANSCPMRESIINLTINLANSSWISQKFLQAIAYNRSPSATAHNLSYHLLLLFVPEQHAHHHHLSLLMAV